jgi:hypothetical protein
MGWNLYLILSLSFFIACLVSRYITGYNISILILIGISLIIAFLWEYIWNKTHAAMHDLEYEYSITKGPYDQGLINTDGLTNLLYQNHEAHHMQKGPTKGNYNVIFLGADEWLQSNNKTIDNTEYCKTHKEEKICKETTHL